MSPKTQICFFILQNIMYILHNIIYYYYTLIGTREIDLCTVYGLCVAMNKISVGSTAKD